VNKCSFSKHQIKLSIKSRPCYNIKCKIMLLLDVSKNRRKNLLR
jgi:hypothetical protein